MDALAGQLRSSVELASHATTEGLAKFEREQSRTPWTLRLRGSLATLRANLTFESAAFRHAIRLAVCVALGAGIGRAVSWHRTYWLPMTVAIVLKPDFTATFSRGVLRVAGTLTGLAFATVLFHLVSTTVMTQILLIGVLTFIAPILRRGELRNPDRGSQRAGRPANRPDRSLGQRCNRSARHKFDCRRSPRAGRLLALADLGTLSHKRKCSAPSRRVPRLFPRDLGGVFKTGRAATQLRHRSPGGRLARSNLEASVDRLSSEPYPSQISALNDMLASSHRLVHALMALEAGLYQSQFVTPRDAFRKFSHDVERTLYFLAASLRGSVIHSGDLPDLREDHHALLRSGDSHVERYALVNIETDRVTNSLNTMREQILAWHS